MELFKSVRLMMAEGKFIQAERALMDLSLQFEGETPIEFFHELFEVRRHLGKETSFSELNSFLTQLSEKKSYQRIDDVLTWWIQQRPYFESAELFHWKLKLAEHKGHIQEVEKQLKLFGLFILNNHYWPQIKIFESYQQKFFKTNYDFIFIMLHYKILTNQTSSAETILSNFIFDEVLKTKRSARMDDDIELIVILLEQSTLKGPLEVWKGLFKFLLASDWGDVDTKKLIEAIIYFESFEVQLIIQRKLYQLGQSELIEVMALSLKKDKRFNFILLEKYFSQDLKPFYFTKKNIERAEYSSLLSKEDLKLDKNLKFTPDQRDEEDHHISEEESLIIAGLKFQELTIEQSLELIVSMIQMNFPLAGREIARKWIGKDLENNQRLKLNYLLLQIHHTLKDYRAGLDIALESTGLAQSSEDILAFTYAEADFYYSLGEKKKARNLYLSILSLVGNYRMTKERLKELDEV